MILIKIVPIARLAAERAYVCVCVCDLRTRAVHRIRAHLHRHVPEPDGGVGQAVRRRSPTCPRTCPHSTCRGRGLPAGLACCACHMGPHGTPQPPPSDIYQI